MIVTVTSFMNYYGDVTSDYIYLWVGNNIISLKIPSEAIIKYSPIGHSYDSIWHDIYSITSLLSSSKYSWWKYIKLYITHDNRW